MRVHKRGIRPLYFAAVKSGRKRFEIRRRATKEEFWVGDELILINEETQENITCQIIYLHDENDLDGYGLQKGFVILGIEVKNDTKEKDGEKNHSDNKGTIALASGTNVLYSQQELIRRAEQKRH